MRKTPMDSQSSKASSRVPPASPALLPAAESGTARTRRWSQESTTASKRASWQDETGAGSQTEKSPLS